VFRALLGRGIVWFIPLSALVASALTAFVFVRGSARAFPELPSATRWLSLLVLLTNYVFLTTMGLYYRATKPLLVPVMLAVLFYVWARLRWSPAAEARAAGWPPFAWLFVGGCLMSAFDRQGFFYLAVLLLGLIVAAARDARARPLVLGAASALALSTTYNYVIGPRLVHALNGYWPRFNYQRMRVHTLLDPSFYAKAAELLPEYAATLFGGFRPGWFGVGLALAGLALWRALPRQSAAPAGSSKALVAAVAFAVFLASQVFMFGAMIMRYPQVYDWADHRLWYYPWPFQALLIFGLLVVLARVFPVLDPVSRRMVDTILVLLAVANVAHWPRNREVSLHSDWFPKIHDQTARLKTSLAEGRADPQLWGAYREFLHFAWDRSPAFAARAADVREGGGFYRTELREGRVFAWARQGASLFVVARRTGSYELRGDLWLRAGEAVTVSRGETRLATFRRAPGAEGEGTEPFAVTLSGLEPGPTELQLESNLAERDVGGLRDHKAVAFGLYIPSLTTTTTP
jgi:hypothetical protein